MSASVRTYESVREISIVKAIVKWMLTQPIWVYKTHGSPYQVAGLPDLIGAYKGIAFGLEVKTIHGVVSDVQQHTMKVMAEKGGWRVGVVRSLEEAQAFVAGLEG